MTYFIQTNHSDTKVFDYNNPRVEDICIKDIASALSKQCRYNGLINNFYSVAQHSCILAELASPANKFVALMHDATEAYTGDIPRPYKRKYPVLRQAEDEIWELIAEKYGLPKEIPQEVHDLDHRILGDEMDVLFDENQFPWDNVGILIIPWEWQKAERLFLEKFYKLRDDYARYR